MEQVLLTLDQTAKILQVSYARAAELARQGVLPITRMGRQIRVAPAALDAFIASGGKGLPGGWRKESEDHSSAA